ncbi:MAG: ATP-binding protein [Piscinibacter sp.]
MNWRRFDTLFVRLFLLMWVTLVGSHLIAWSVAAPSPGMGHPAQVVPDDPPPWSGPQGPGQGPPPGPPRERPLPPLATLPPADLPAGTQWTDYLLRMAVIALGAALGARWLAAPMRRLSKASAGLSDALARGRKPDELDVDHGTNEVRATARVFNTMAARLQQQFDARSLEMAALSHDLRTPLTRLRLRLERLPEDLAGAAVADVREMDDMIDATLEVMREQRDDAPRRVIDAVALLQALADDHAELGHEVSLDDGLTPARVHAHPAAMRRVLGNLIGNALRYGRCARIGLTVRDGQVEIHVDDDGPGLPPERIEQAFAPWVRLAGDAGRSDHGHGLGLAIARDLAERDGGTLSLANRPEGGLRATLRLPAA